MDIKFLKKNKFTFFVVLFFIILFILLLQVKNLFFPKSGEANYGDRLDGVVEIHDDVLANATTKLKENGNVEEATISVNGLRIDIIITILDTVSVKDAKAMIEQTKTLFDGEVLSAYDIQVFAAKKSAAENDFPIVGYKAKKNENFSFSKDRPKTVAGEEEE